MNCSGGLNAAGSARTAEYDSSDAGRWRAQRSRKFDGGMMAVYVTVANRKGGVGKSTVSTMLAHAFSVWGRKRVLLIDVDSQCNASLILLGGRGWYDARQAGKSIVDYFGDYFRGGTRSAAKYLINEAGDVADDSGKAPHLSLLSGSLLLDDMQGDFFMSEADNLRPMDAFLRLRETFEATLRSMDGEFDLVILDCAPGVSFATLAAIKIADKVLVPFRPDYVSFLAIDRIALIIEGVRKIDDLEKIPVNNRRYSCVANYVRGSGAEKLLIDEISVTHPVLATRLWQSEGIAEAFDWLPQRRSLTQKYGDAVADLRKLYDEVVGLLAHR